MKEPISNQSYSCRICLWIFESGSELEIHNYLEHMIINQMHKRTTEDITKTYNKYMDSAYAMHVLAPEKVDYYA
jgi:hypothetical protein